MRHRGPALLLALIALPAVIGTPALAGSVTIVRSGASVDEFVGGEDKHSLEDSQYTHGILLGDGFGSATPRYRILLPPPSAAGNQITSITVSVEGDNGWFSWPDVQIGNQGPYTLGDSLERTFTGSTARNLLTSAGDGVGYHLDIEIDVGGLTDQYDLKEIRVTYEYSNVPNEFLERFQQTYGAYRLLKQYEADMVSSLWNTGAWTVEEYFYPACQESLAVADNLSNLSGDLYSALKGTIDVIENFQSMADILDAAFDYTIFWIKYTGPEESDVSADLIDARDALKALAQSWRDRTFDGDISGDDPDHLNGYIQTARSEVTTLRGTMWDVSNKSFTVYVTGNSDGDKTAQIMLHSLAPLLNVTYDETHSSSEPSYLTGLIAQLQTLDAGISLPEAVDRPTWSISTGGSADWFGQDGTYYYDGDAAQSGDISHSQESWMQTVVSGPGSVSFYWKVSSESGWDYLEFYVDGTREDRISGSVNWGQETFAIAGTGSHTLKWRYTKDGSVNAGSDCGWVDKVAWTATPHTVATPSTPSGPSTGVPDTSYTFTTGGSSCSWGHSVEYQFDWGDGSSSSWGSSSRSKSWASTDTYTVKARARCTSDTSVVSGWSGGKTVTVVYPPTLDSITPTSGPKNTYAKIEGEHFGSAEGAVCFTGGTGDIISWSDTTIYCRVPEGVTAGPVFVRTAGAQGQLFADSFDSTTIDGSKWTSISGATVDGVGINEPSSPYSLRLNGHPSGGDSIASKVIDLSASGATLSCHWERTGNGNSTETGEDLIAEYWDGSTWVEIGRQLGSGPDMSSYTSWTIPLPAEASHSGFRLRFRSIGTTGAYDDWFIDDVALSATIDSNAVTFTITVPDVIHVNNTTNVPGIENGTATYPFSTVQRGIDAASDGAEVVVAEGTYAENVNFNGKPITVRSSDPDDPAVVAATIIDGNQSGSVVTFNNGEGSDSVLAGLTIRHGKAPNGGGVYCRASPTIEKCVIRDNIASNDWGSGWGGGIYCGWGEHSPIIRNNVIVANTAGDEDVQEPWAWGHGGGIYWCSSGETGICRNNTIVGNEAADQGGGVFVDYGISLAVTSCILYGNSADGGPAAAVMGDEWSPSSLAIEYCNVQGGEQAIRALGSSGSTVTWGDGNIDVASYFVGGGDYHLKSQTGRRDPGGGWVTDAVTSPCVDAGDPASGHTNEPSPNGSRVNMGAYGNTTQASKSVPDTQVASALPDSGPHYTLMKVSGSWFGVVEGTVEMSGADAGILSWTDTEIRCEVQPDTTSGPLVVRRLNGVQSNMVTFDVTDPDTIYVDDDNASGIENGTLTWPFSTIQRALLAATEGDTIIVAEGTYAENVDFLGKAVTVRSTDPDDPDVIAATVINGGGQGSSVRFTTGEGIDSVLRGFTIRDGSGTDHYGGGIYCEGTSPLIEKNRIVSNTAHFHGGGVYCKGGGPTIQDNVVADNVTRWFGGGITCWDSEATVIRNTIHGNSAHWYGGGIFIHGPASPTLKNNVVYDNSGSEGGGIACIYECSPTIENLTVASNNAERSGGGLYAGWDCAVSALNMIVWGNVAEDGPQLALAHDASLEIAYSDIGGGQDAVAEESGCSLTWGEGNIDELPLFASLADFHLRSTGGRYVPSAGLPPEDPGAWVADLEHSPCIDTGSPDSTYDLELPPNGDCINMGAYGNTPFASKSEALEAAATVVPILPTGATGEGNAPHLTATAPELGSEVSGMRTLTLTFDKDVKVGGSAVEVYGSAVLNKAKTTYDAFSHTLRLEWPSAVPPGAYDIRVIADFVIGVEDNASLDGEIHDPRDPGSLPSGDGTPGGDSRFEFRVVE